MGRIMRALAFAALCALAAAPVAAQPLNPRPAVKTEMRVYDLGLNDPVVATEIIRGLLSPEGRVYPDPAATSGSRSARGWSARTARARSKEPAP